jgi:HlyD family secretion protein
MKTWQKVSLGIGAAAVLGGIVWYSVYQANKGVVEVQTGKVVKADLTSIVTASGEVRPKNYTNVLGEGIGKITEIVVKEGDHVKKGDILLKLENIQPGADVQAQQAQIDSNEAGMRMSQANYDSAVATLAQRQADLTKAKFDFDRTQKLYDQQLIAKSDYDAGKATFDSASAALTAGGTGAGAVQSGPIVRGPDAHQRRVAENDVCGAD